MELETWFSSRFARLPNYKKHEKLRKELERAEIKYTTLKRKFDESEKICNFFLGAERVFESIRQNKIITLTRRKRKAIE
jgi:hypothetical protein